jgi:four helix bundle protein
MAKTVTVNTNRITSYKELEIWQNCMDLVKEIYCITRDFPISEQQGMIPQMRHAAIAVSSNIAEGYSSQSSDEYRYYLSMSQDFIQELEKQILQCKKHGYIEVYSADKLLPDVREVSKMLNTLISKIM